MPVVYPCPLCGRSVNRRGQPLDEPGKTKAHIDGAHDDRHDGERGDNHMEDIRGNAVEVDEGELPAPTNRQNPSNDGLSVIEVNGEKVPITNAVKANHDAIMSPEDFGLASHFQVEELTERVGNVEDQLDQLTRFIEVLATESETLEGNCPDCGGRLTITTTGSSIWENEKQVACESCGRPIAA